MKEVRQVLLNIKPSKWTIAFYKMRFGTVATKYHNNFADSDIPQDAAGMVSARILPGLMGPLQKLARALDERKSALKKRNTGIDSIGQSIGP